MTNQDPTHQPGQQPAQHPAPQDPAPAAKQTPTVWRPAEETDRVRAAANGLGTLRVARKEPGMAGEIMTGLVISAVSAGAIWGFNGLLSLFGDAGWTIIFRGLLIILVAAVLFGLVYAVRALFRAHMAVYLYDFGLVGVARGRTRTIRWEQATQVTVFSTEGVHLLAEGGLMVIPGSVVGKAEDQAEFLAAIVPPLEQRGVEVVRF